MGAIGPRRVALKDDGTAPNPPYQVINNEYTWLDKSDLVFIDPVSTGFSRPASGESAKQFHGYVEDLQSMGSFIRHFLSRYERWGSPKFSQEKVTVQQGQQVIEIFAGQSPHLYQWNFSYFCHPEFWK
jgi:carboxypeptidase C (cathepsin A)